MTHTHEILDRFVLHEPVVAAPALGGGAAVEEHVLLARVAVVVAVHQRRLLPHAHQIFYQTLK